MNEGDFLWIGNFVSIETGPISSTGSPKTLKIRPRVALPTGTLIASPKSATDIPLFRPSVDVIDTALTLLLPSNCCTSQIIADCPSPIRRAL